jgi:hypothetical protein
MLGRLVEFVLFGFLLWLAYEGVKARVRAFFSGNSTTPTRSSRSPRSSGQPSETLVRCFECGTHVVKSRAFSSRDQPEVYCSERCRGAAERRNRS